MRAESLEATYYPAKNNIFLFNRAAFLLVVLVNIFVVINIFVVGESTVLTTLVYFLIFTIFFFNNDKLLFYLLFISIVTSNFFTGFVAGYEFGNFLTATITADLSEAIAYALILIIILKNRVKHLLRFNDLGIAFIVFIAYCFFTAIFAEYPDFTISSSFRFLSFFTLYLLTVYYIKTELNYKEFINIVVASSLFLILIIPFKLVSNLDPLYTGGSYFMFMLPLLTNILAYIILSKKINLTDFAFYSVLNIFGIISMILTNSRRYFIGFTIYIIAFLIAIRSKLLSITAITVLGIGIVVFISLPGQLFFRIDETLETIGEGYESGSTQSFTETSTFLNKRDLLFRLGIEIFQQYPITGCGLLNSNKLIGKVTGTDTRIHNLYLQILADLGLIGFTMYVVIVVILILKLYSAYKYYASTGNLFMKLQTFAVFLYIVAISIVAFLGAHFIYNKFDWIVYGIIVVLSENIPKNQLKEKNAER